MPTTIHDQAVCIRHWDWSETSQTVSLFTHTHGIIRGLAKGSKREKTPFSGGIELLTQGEIVALVRSGGTLATITAWHLTHPYTGIRRSLRAFYVGSYLMDLVHHAVTDADPHPGLFTCLVEVLDRLSDRPEHALLLGQWGVLTETGYTPALEPTAAPSHPGTIISFLPQKGLFVQREFASTHDGWRVRPETVELLYHIAQQAVIPAETDAITIERASRLLGSYIRHVLARDLPSAQPVFGPEGLVT
ncbi:hypothetical protein MNBD_PLANCTO03-1335 [hydrothermal vent metagenome]|uniref:DNA repair protein RecO n=1 Tax=hydrothermal vent metagenome TaxID=652676 RepID=A0A3B1D189_9ZZZZ